MANKQALRDLQTRLAERLQAARTEPLAKAWLAVECSSRGFLFPLRDAGEIFAMSPLLTVPHSHRWFLGVANLRGHLHVHRLQPLKDGDDVHALLLKLLLDRAGGGRELDLEPNRPFVDRELLHKIERDDIAVEVGVDYLAKGVEDLALGDGH